MGLRFPEFAGAPREILTAVPGGSPGFAVIAVEILTPEVENAVKIRGDFQNRVAPFDAVAQGGQILPLGLDGLDVLGDQVLTPFFHGGGQFLREI